PEAKLSSADGTALEGVWESRTPPEFSCGRPAPFRGRAFCVFRTLVLRTSAQFLYLPFALVVFWPLGWVSEPVARVVWTLATLVAVVGTVAALVA
ncbi:hypothetical protein, partial [Embleya sp. AB8]|uniref:hypothetical protein n=1 Tax=Embleya sp. AB8 TaxID=3156304 RepID=UPI003C74B03A